MEFLRGLDEIERQCKLSQRQHSSRVRDGTDRSQYSERLMTEPKRCGFGRERRSGNDQSMIVGCTRAELCSSW